MRLIDADAIEEKLEKEICEIEAQYKDPKRKYPDSEKFDPSDFLRHRLCVELQNWVKVQITVDCNGNPIETEDDAKARVLHEGTGIRIGMTPDDLTEWMQEAKKGNVRK